MAKKNVEGQRAIPSTDNPSDSASRTSAGATVRRQKAIQRQVDALDQGKPDKQAKPAKKPRCRPANARNRKTRCLSST